MEANGHGAQNLIERALRDDASLLYASTSPVTLGHLVDVATDAYRLGRAGGKHRLVSAAFAGLRLIQQVSYVVGWRAQANGRRH